jgi:IrrE N-terminal-like domain
MLPSGEWENRAARERTAIEAVAERVLGRLAQLRPQVAQPSIAIDDIVQFSGLSIDFDDLAAMDYPETYAATFAADRLIMVDEAIEPVSHPDKEGLYTYTLAHELGHWHLHRTGEQLNLFRLRRYGATFCRRIEDGGQPPPHEEWQADYFAACLTMPRAAVAYAWQALLGHGGPLLCDRTCSDLQRSLHIPSSSRTKRADWHVAGSLARVFRVSAPAMKYRLEEMGLLPDQSARCFMIDR